MTPVEFWHYVDVAVEQQHANRTFTAAMVASILNTQRSSKSSPVRAHDIVPPLVEIQELPSDDPQSFRAIMRTRKNRKTMDALIDSVSHAI